MDLASIGDFLFGTYPGIGVLLGIGILVSIILSALMELKTRKTFVDRGEREDDDDEWSFFDDDES